MMNTNKTIDERLFERLMQAPRQMRMMMRAEFGGPEGKGPHGPHGYHGHGGPVRQRIGDSGFYIDCGHRRAGIYPAFEENRRFPRIGRRKDFCYEKGSN